MPSPSASKIFSLLLFLLIVDLSLVVGLGKGAHQFSKVLFPFRYWLEVKKNDYQTFLNKLATPLPTSPPITFTPTIQPTRIPTAYPQRKYTPPKSNQYYYVYPTSKPYQYPTPMPWPTYDNTWYNQQVQKSQQDYQNRVNQMNQDYQNSVLKMQQETEAWKISHGF